MPCHFFIMFSRLQTSMNSESQKCCKKILSDLLACKSRKFPLSQLFHFRRAKYRNKFHRCDEKKRLKVHPQMEPWERTVSHVSNLHFSAYLFRQIDVNCSLMEKSGINEGKSVNRYHYWQILNLSSILHLKLNNKLNFMCKLRTPSLAIHCCIFSREACQVNFHSQRLVICAITEGT